MPSHWLIGSLALLSSVCYWLALALSDSHQLSIQSHQLSIQSHQLYSQVTYEEGRNFADDNDLEFLEASAKLDINVNASQ